MNRYDVVKITKITKEFNGLSWPDSLTQAMIDNGLYGIYLRASRLAPLVSINGSTYYIPEESLEIANNVMILFTASRGGNVRITSYDGANSLTVNNELKVDEEGDEFLKFETHQQARDYIRQNIDILNEY